MITIPAGATLRGPVNLAVQVNDESFVFPLKSYQVVLYFNEDANYIPPERDSTTEQNKL